MSVEMWILTTKVKRPKMNKIAPISGRDIRRINIIKTKITQSVEVLNFWNRLRNEF